MAALLAPQWVFVSPPPPGQVKHRWRAAEGDSEQRGTPPCGRRAPCPGKPPGTQQPGYGHRQIYKVMQPRAARHQVDRQQHQSCLQQQSDSPGRLGDGSRAPRREPEHEPSCPQCQQVHQPGEPRAQTPDHHNCMVGNCRSLPAEGAARQWHLMPGVGPGEVETPSAGMAGNRCELVNRQLKAQDSREMHSPGATAVVAVATAATREAAPPVAEATISGWAALDAATALEHSRPGQRGRDRGQDRYSRRRPLPYRESSGPGPRAISLRPPSAISR